MLQEKYATFLEKLVSLNDPLLSSIFKNAELHMDHSNVELTLAFSKQFAFFKVSLGEAEHLWRPIFEQVFGDIALKFEFTVEICPVRKKPEKELDIMMNQEFNIKIDDTFSVSQESSNIFKELHWVIKFSCMTNNVFILRNIQMHLVKDSFRFTCGHDISKIINCGLCMDYPGYKSKTHNYYIDDIAFITALSRAVMDKMKQFNLFDAVNCTKL